MKKDDKFADFMGKSFKLAWVKYKTADEFGSKTDTLKSILKFGRDG